MADSDLRRWELTGVVALMVIVLSIPAYLARHGLTRADELSPDQAAASFVGSDTCRRCHESAYESWKDSDHDHAMAEANEATVLADFDDAELTHRGITSRFFRRDGRFFVLTEGPGGAMAEFEVPYTFGVRPLQQYLVRFPGGRLQALSLAWDVPGERWFHLYQDQDIPPDDWLHWTRNSMNWNGMCAECHSTNLEKGYDPETDTYTTTWSEIDVGCEACHGPGSRHVDWAEIQPMARPEVDDYSLVVPTSGTTPEEQVELCAPCHSRRSELGDWDHTGGQLLDHMVPSLLVEGLYHADGQILDEVYVYSSFLQSKMYQRGVKCSDCHDVHSLERLRPDNQLCLQCHQGEVYDSYDHHFHKKVHEGRPSDGALCVRCHMPEQPYMVVDWRADHSLRLPRPDLTEAIGTPNACAQEGCHDDRPLEWLLDATRRWYGSARRPHYGTAFAAGREGRPEAHDELLRLAENALQPAMVRATALSLLDRFPGEASTRVLRSALFSDDPLIRHTAVRSLVATGPEERAELVAPLLSDPVRAVRLAAVPQLAGLPKELLKPYQRDAFREALAEYRRTLEHSLDFAASGASLGNLYHMLGQPDEAERYYRLAIGIDDLFFPAKMNLAVLLSAEGRNEEAGTLLREVLAAYPDNHDASYSLGLLLVEMGRPGEALHWLDRAAAGMPGNSRAHYNLGLLLQQRGRLDEARARLARAVELEPDRMDYLFALADHHLKRGQPRQVIAIAERMIELEPENRVGHELKAIAERAAAGSSPRRP